MFFFNMQYLLVFVLKKTHRGSFTNSWDFKSNLSEIGLPNPLKNHHLVIQSIGHAVHRDVVKNNLMPLCLQRHALRNPMNKQTFSCTKSKNLGKILMIFIATSMVSKPKQNKLRIESQINNKYFIHFLSNGRPKLSYF